MVWHRSIEARGRQGAIAMNTRFLETLVWLARLGSFSKAAEKLNTTQPAVSSRITKLEDYLGVALYRHGERPFQLTAAGHKILRHAEEIVGLAAELRDIAKTEDASENPISVGVVEMVTLSWLPALIERIKVERPQATVSFGTGSTRQLIKKLRDGRIDLVFGVGAVDEPDTSTFRICTMGQVWAANPAYYDCESEIDVGELTTLPLVLHRSGTSGNDQVMEYFRSHGIEQLKTQSQKLTLDCAYSIVTAMGLVRAGLAVMLLPSVLLCDEALGHRLAPMRVRQPPPSFDVYACWKRPVSNPLVVRLVALASVAAQALATRRDVQRLCAIQYSPAPDSLSVRA
jgi:DNA-binding transcriptional LysR family regulator